MVYVGIDTFYCSKCGKMSDWKLSPPEVITVPKDNHPKVALEGRGLGPKVYQPVKVVKIEKNEEKEKPKEKPRVDGDLFSYG
jgi:hypothetical protein